MRIAQGYGDTNTGRKRRRNEDTFVYEPPLFAVADGMGGAQAGEVASSLAAGALREGRESGSTPGTLAGEARVIELIQEANRRVHQRAQDDAAASGMGTTMTVALFSENGVVTIGHVGDSRAYVLRGGELEQLTEDHSLVAELVRRGELSPEEAETHPQRSVITRALGTDPDVDVDTFSVEAQPGDVFLLCSDGLTSMVDAHTITAIVEQHRDDLRAATRALIRAANDRGGDDNITAVLFRVDEGALDETVELAPLDAEDTAEIPVVGSEGSSPPEEHAPAVTSFPRPNDTAIMSATDLHSALTAAGAHEAAAGAGRKVLALVVILALAALVVVLVVWGLAR